MRHLCRVLCSLIIIHKRPCISFQIRPSPAVRSRSRYHQRSQNSRVHAVRSSKQKGDSSSKQVYDISFRSRDLLNSFEQRCRGRKDKQGELLEQEVESFLKRVDRSNLIEHIVPRDASSLIRLLGRNRAFDAMVKFCRRYCRDIIDSSGSSSSTKGIRDAEESVLYCYTAAISACSKPSNTSNKYRSKSFLFSLLDEMENGYTENGRPILPNSFTLSAILVGIDNGYEALDILEQFEQKYEVDCTQQHRVVTVQVYNAAIASCGKSAKDQSKGQGRNVEGWQLGLSLYNKMKRYGPKPNEQTHMSILWTCAEYGQVRVALSIFDEVTQTSTHSIAAAAKLYKPLLKACSIAGNTNAAESLIQRMKDEKLTITTEHMNLLLLTLAKYKMQTRALEVLHEMINSQESNQSIAPDIISFNTVLLACANAEDYETAQDLLDQMKEGMFHVPVGDGSMVEIRPDVISYNTVISCADPEAALGLINEMRLTRRNRFGVVMPNSVTYTNAVARCRKASNSSDLEIRQYAYDIAFTLFELAQERSSTGEEVDINVFVYGSLIWMAESVGNHRVAVQLLRSMKCAPNSVCYDGVISALSRRGLARDALYFYYEMQKLGLHATRGTYLKLSLAINNSRDIELSISPRKQAALLEGVLSQMPERDRYVDIGGPLFELLIRCHGERTEPGSSYAAARSVFDQILGPVDNAVLCAMLSVYSSCKTMWKDAVQLLHTSDIVRDSSGPGQIGRRALSQAVIACSKADEWEEALNLISLYGNKEVSTGTKPEDRSEVVSIAAINAVIGACGRSKRPDVAVQILNDMNDKYGVAPDELSYRLAIIACNQAEHREAKQAKPLPDGSSLFEFTWWECALSLLRRMLEDGLVPDAQTYSSTVSALESGKWVMCSAISSFHKLKLNRSVYSWSMAESYWSSTINAIDFISSGQQLTP